MIFKITRKRRVKKSDEELLDTFISTGDLEILGELYSEYMHLVYGVCLKYLKDREESMDAVMQIFEKLISELPNQKIIHFKSWLHSVTRNFCLMKIRSQKSLDEKHNEWIKENTFFMENEPDPHPIDESGPDMELALIDCINRLKDEQKLCIEMFYFDNKCYNEIAAELRMDEKKVKSYLQNGKRNLKLCLEGK